MTVTNFEDLAREASSDATKREQSSILFPYLDLDAAIEVTRAVYNRSGHGSCELHELAAEMGQVVSGAFRLKTGAARIFELTEKEGRGGIQLTELGKQILSPETERAARAEAFMRVPLYERVYDRYKGQRLPPSKALEREMQSLGVSSKQTDKARQAFERSAKQAGYFESGDDRLVRPRADGLTTKIQAEPEHTARGDRDRGDDRGRRDTGTGGSGGGAGGGGSGGGQHHPLIEGLLVTLPKIGTAWPEEDRKAWLKMADSIFAMIYPKGSDARRSGIDDELDELLE